MASYGNNMSDYHEIKDKVNFLKVKNDSDALGM